MTEQLTTQNNILIVDDVLDNLDLLSRILTRRGYAVRSVETGTEAIAIAKTGWADLILLDIYMQQENGLDLLPELRSAGRPVDVIIISSAADAATIKTSLNYGVVDYLIKPFQFARFEEALTGWRQKKSLMDNHQFYQQSDVDQLLHGNPPGASEQKRLPKGLTPQTLRTLCLWIDSHPGTEFSTDELATEVNISRVSCRKYLIWLAQINILFTSIHYGVTGRPVYRYRLQPEYHTLLKQYCQ